MRIEFGLFVTGHGEHQALAQLFGPLRDTGLCQFTVLRRIGQLRPRQEQLTAPTVAGARSRRRLPFRDERLALWALGHLTAPDCDFVVLIDDQETPDIDEATRAFRRYREAFDFVLHEHSRCASVHFLVLMLEAYFLADASATNAVLGTDLQDHNGDVEALASPKAHLKRVARYDEVEHARRIIPRLNLPHILRNSEHCRSLRTLFAWCAKAAGISADECDLNLDADALYDVTRGQLDTIPEPGPA